MNNAVWPTLSAKVIPRTGKMQVFEFAKSLQVNGTRLKEFAKSLQNVANLLIMKE